MDAPVQMFDLYRNLKLFNKFNDTMQTPSGLLISIFKILDRYFSFSKSNTESVELSFSIPNFNFEATQRIMEEWGVGSDLDHALVSTQNEMEDGM